MLNLVLAGSVALSTIGGVCGRAARPSASLADVQPPTECNPDEVSYLVGAIYADDFGGPQLHTEIICSDPDGHAAELRVDAIDKNGFERAAHDKIAHGAVRRIYYYPVR